MSEAPRDRADPLSGPWDEQFTVPVPRPDASTSGTPSQPPTPGPAATPTQALPVPGWTPADATADRTSGAPAGATAGATATAPPPGQPTRPLPLATLPPPPYGAAGRPSAPGADASVDPLLGQVGVALFWITVGWWLFVLVRLLGWFVRYGATDTMLIRTIDLGVEETLLAAALSVLAALLLLAGRGRAGRSPLGWAALALCVVTVAVAVWRVLP